MVAVEEVMEEEEAHRAVLAAGGLAILQRGGAGESKIDEKAKKVGSGGGPGSRSRKRVKTEGPGPS